MPTFKTMSEPGAVDALAARFNGITPQSTRRWGRMTAHQMLCHISDAFLVINGTRPIARRADNVFTRTVMKFFALRTPFPWPKGVPTMAECDAEKEGTPPDVFAEDRAKSVEMLRQFAIPSAVPLIHPLFGPMTHEEWMIWAYRHTDHHLRQFSA